MIRKAKKEDFEDIFKLLKELWPNEGFNKENTKSIFLEVFKDREMLVAEEDKRLIGFISLSFIKNIQDQGLIGRLEEFIVTKEHRGKGIGKEMLDAITLIAKEKNCKTIDFPSTFKRKETHKFYEKQGFRKVSYYFTKQI